MRTQPNITVVAPCDASQARAAVRAIANCAGPVYLRLGKDDRLEVPGLMGRFALGRVDVVHEGPDVLLVAVGAVVVEAVEAARTLARRNIGATVIAVSSLNPVPRVDLLSALVRFRTVLTMEAHYVTGGLGSLVCELVAEEGLNCRVERCGVKTRPGGATGSQAYLHELHGISAARLVAAAVDALERRDD